MPIPQTVFWVEVDVSPCGGRIPTKVYHKPLTHYSSAQGAGREPVSMIFQYKSLLGAVRIEKNAQALRMSTKDVTYSVSNQNISLIESICCWKDQSFYCALLMLLKSENIVKVWEFNILHFVLAAKWSRRGDQEEEGTVWDKGASGL